MKTQPKKKSKHTSNVFGKNPVFAIYLARSLYNVL